jgi:hypothetical protein
MALDRVCGRDQREKGGNAMLRYERYKRRFWAVYEDDALLCVTVYLKGALSVIERVTGVRPDPPIRKKRAPLPPIRRRRPSQELWSIHDR